MGLPLDPLQLTRTVNRLTSSSVKRNEPQTPLSWNKPLRIKTAGIRIRLDRNTEIRIA